MVRTAVRCDIPWVGQAIHGGRGGVGPVVQEHRLGPILEFSETKRSAIDIAPEHLLLKQFGIPQPDKHMVGVKPGPTLYLAPALAHLMAYSTNWSLTDAQVSLYLHSTMITMVGRLFSWKFKENLGLTLACAMDSWLLSCSLKSTVPDVEWSPACPRM